MDTGVIKARLYPDYGGSPLWLPLLVRLDWDEIKVSPELRARLADWVDDYEHGTRSWTEEDFVAEGHALTGLLSEKLGWKISYSA